MLLTYLLILTYAGLILWFAYGFAQTKSFNHPEGPVEKPFLSVIIAARNEINNLPGLLDALLRQDLESDQFEIIIINDRSTDNTSDYLNSASADISNLKVLHIESTETGWAPKKWALQQGIDASCGEIIVQTDADCQPDSGWLTCIQNEFCNAKLGFLTGPAPLSGPPSEINRALELDSLSQDAFSAGGLSRNKVLSCTGRNMAYRRIIFDEVGGYEDIFHFPSGDDDLLLQKIASRTNYCIRFLACPEMLVVSPPPLTWSEFVKQRLRFASKGSAYYKLDTTIALRILLPFLWLVNLAVLWSLSNFMKTAALSWFLVWIIKLLADTTLTLVHYSKINYRFPVLTMLWMSVIHPFYVVIFGILGSLVKVSWKD